MSTTYQADNPIPPRAGGVIALTTTTVAAATTVPTSMQGRFVTMVASVDSYVLFATTSGITATSGIGDVSTTNGVSAKVPADVPIAMRLDGSDDWVHHVAASTGVIRMWISSP